ncbi:MAG: hypothetical protein K1X89_29355, partial [Myxococcaceae bacterium]|nr:hypothetical protein [Myxococcaceae bacterium]
GGGSASSGGGSASSGGGSASSGGGSASSGGGSASSGGGQGCGACNTPPSGCFQAQGTCVSGTCTYPFANGAACDDQDACTLGDVCDQGRCQGTPKSCTTPPQSSCAAGTAHQYAPTGTCSAGTCSYAVVDVSCPSGCSGTACAAPTCGAATCNAPPAATCVSSSTLQFAAAIGGCDAGQCDYARRTIVCSEGCFNGACLPGSWESEQLQYDWSWDSVAMAVDPLDRVHLVGCAPGGTVEYFGETASGWIRETVDPNLGTGCEVAITLKNGQPLLAYYEPTNKDLRYAERTGPNTWTKQLVSSAGDVGRGPSIALNANGAPVISYNSSSGSGVATKTGTGWTLSPILGADGLRSQVLLDDLGRLHVLFGEEYSYKITNQSNDQPSAWHAVSSDAGWNLTELDSDALIGPRSMARIPGGVQILYGAQRRLSTSAAEELRRAWYTTGPQRDELVHRYASLIELPTHPGGFFDVGEEPGIAYGTFDLQRRNHGHYREVFDAGPELHVILDVLPGPSGRGRVLTTTHLYNPRYENQIVREPVCVPACSGKACGDDGCGGVCGHCAAGSSCAPDGTCGGWAWTEVPLPFICAVSQPVAVASSATVSHAATWCGRTDALNSVSVNVYSAPAAADFSSVVEHDRGLPTFTAQSLALSPQGSPELLLTLGQTNAGALSLFTQLDGGSQATAVPGAPTSATWPALAIDAQGHHHVAYRAFAGDGGLDLVYATDVTGSWVHKVAVPSATARRAWSSDSELASIAVDPSGVVHLAYLREEQTNPNALLKAQVHHASGTSAGFTDELIDPAYHFDEATAPNPVGTKRARARLAVGGATPIICYGAGKCAFKGTSAWTVESLPAATQEFAVTTDGSGALVAAVLNPDLQLSRRTAANAWQPMPLGGLPFSVAPSGVQLARDPLGKLSVLVWLHDFGFGSKTPPVLHHLRQR